jgi:hypothetical protein
MNWAIIEVWSSAVPLLQSKTIACSTMAVALTFVAYGSDELRNLYNLYRVTNIANFIRLR